MVSVGTVEWHLTQTGTQGEVVTEARGTLALIHARVVDTFSRFFTDTGVQQTLIDIWGGNTFSWFIIDNLKQQTL